MNYKELKCYRVEVTKTTEMWVPTWTKGEAITQAIYTATGPGYFLSWKVIRVKVKSPRTIQLPSWLKVRPSF